MSKTQAMLDWFHGRTDKPMPTPETDVGEAFFAGWDAREAAAVRAQDVRAPAVVHWVEAVTLQPRVSLPASDYAELIATRDPLKRENAELRERLRNRKTDLETAERQLIEAHAQIAELKHLNQLLSIAGRADHNDNTRLTNALTEITDLDLEGDASLADAIRIADEALHPPPTNTT